MKKGKALLDKHINAPSILVLITEEEPWKRKLIYAYEKRKGSLTDAFFVMAMDINDIKENPRVLLTNPRSEPGERIYLPDGKGGHHDGIKRFEKPTPEEKVACKEIFDAAMKNLGGSKPQLQIPDLLAA